MRRSLGLGLVLWVITGCDISGNTLVKVTVNVTNSGTGAGEVEAPQVSGNQASASQCHVGANSACSFEFVDLGGVGSFALSGRPGQGSAFAGWGGDCGIGPQCTLSFTRGTNTEVSFDVQVTFTGLTAPTFALANPSFELAVLTGGLPSGPGVWRGDLAASVAPVAVPPSSPTGGRVLQFQGSSPTGALAGGLASQMWQIVDVSPLAAEIDAGRVKLDGGVLFNRAPTGPNSDKLFGMQLFGYSGVPANFPAAYQPQTALRVQRVDLLSDGDPATWERVVGTIDLPAGTRYVVIEIFAFEDVADDATAPEFDGHFADDVTLVIRVAP